MTLGRVTLLRRTTYLERRRGGAVSPWAPTGLPFKVEATEEMLTANARLVLFGELVRGLELTRWLKQEMLKPGSGRGYKADAYVTPLVLMFAGGGRSLEDLRTLKGDTALATLLERSVLPSADAVGDWLRRTGEQPCSRSNVLGVPRGIVFQRGVHDG